MTLPPSLQGQAGEGVGAAGRAEAAHTGQTRGRGSQQGDIGRTGPGKYYLAGVGAFSVFLGGMALMLLACLVAMAGWWPLEENIGSEFMPDLDEGDLLYMPSTFPAVSIGKAQELLQQTDRLISQLTTLRFDLALLTGDYTTREKDAAEAAAVQAGRQLGPADAGAERAGEQAADQSTEEPRVPQHVDGPIDGVALGDPTQVEGGRRRVPP